MSPPILLSFALVACAEPSDPQPEELVGGQTGEEMPVPCLSERSAVAWDAVQESVGASPAEWVGGWPAAGWSASLYWANGVEDTVAISVSADPDTAVLVSQVPAATGVEPADCPDLLEISASLSWLSASFSMTADTTLRSEGDLAWLSASIPDGGTVVEIAGEAPAEEVPVVDLSAGLGPSSTWGTVSVFGTVALPGDWVELATWGDFPD